MENFFQSSDFFNMMKFCNNFTQILNILFFFKNINLLKSKIFSTEKDNYNIVLKSGECLIIMNITPFFFYEFFQKNYDKYFVKQFLLHKGYLEVLFKKNIDNNDLKILDFNTKEIFKIYVKNKIKIFPKTLLTKHYCEYITFLGPIRYFSTFSFENHHSTIKKEVEKRSKNIAITAFFLNFNFVEYNSNNFILNKVVNENKYYIQYRNIHFNDKTIDENCSVDLLENKNIGKIVSIWRRKSDNEIILNSMVLEIEKDNLGIYWKTKKNKSTIFKNKYLRNVKKISNLLKKNKNFFEVISYNI